MSITSSFSNVARTSIDNEVHWGSSGPSNMSNFLPAKRGFKTAC